MITPYKQNMAEDLRVAYHRMIAGVPHCWQAAPQIWQRTLDTWSGHQGLEPLQATAALVARAGDQPVGYVHYGIRPNGPPRDDGLGPIYQSGPLGTVGCFWYLPGYLTQGLTLLTQATEALRQQGAHTIRAWHYDETFRHYHLEHAYLSGFLGHIEAALGLAGFEPTQGETTLAWQNMTPQPGNAPPTLRLEPQWDSDEKRPGLVLRAFDSHGEVGICVAKPAFADTTDREALRWLYTPWLAVAPHMQQRGIGRFLLLTTLETMAKEGYQHTAICCISDNYPALALYSNLGYRVTDQTRVWMMQLP